MCVSQLWSILRILFAVAAPSNGESFALENRLTCDNSKTTKGIVAFRLILFIHFFGLILAPTARARLSVTLYRHNCLAIAIWHTARHLYSLIRPFLEHKFHVTRASFLCERRRQFTSEHPVFPSNNYNFFRLNDFQERHWSRAHGKLIRICHNSNMWRGSRSGDEYCL